MADTIQVDYDALGDLASDVRAKADDVRALLKRVASQADTVEASWVGEGSKAFQTEARDVLLPALERLHQGLDQAGVTITQISERMLAAEEEAAALLAGAAAGGFLAGLADFFKGAWAELKDMGIGLWNMLRDPPGAVRGLWYAATHLGETWEALKQPYVEAWESGHPWQAIGRGTMFIGSVVLGTKGADKVAKLAKASRAAQVTADAMEAGARAGSVTNAAREIGIVAKGSRAETALARYLAEQSTETYRVAGTADRVVIGGVNPNPARNFLGYLEEAKAHGGTAFNTPSNVKDLLWEGNKPGRVVNREFMQAQVERGVGRFDLGGETVSEVLGPRRTLSGTADEVRFLQRYGYEYGYRFEPGYGQVGDSWVKVGDWRASTAGRGAGAAVGPALDVAEDIPR